MAQQQMLVAEKRTKTGTSECRRLRRNGLIPGNLYGHGQDPEMFSVPADALNSLVQSGARILDLQLDGDTEKTMFRELQWDTFGVNVLHFDLLRIDAQERVTVEVSLELKGVSPGVTDGGRLDHHTRFLSLECPAIQIPDSISVRIGSLEIGDAIHVSDLEIPDGFEIHNPPESVVVQVFAPLEEEEEEVDGAELGPAEPEVIGRKEETEDESE
jgi:large subunit ribosomal protein L25